MMFRRSLALVVFCAFLVAVVPAQNGGFNYPKPPRGNQVDNYHGTMVSDPYRWMEDTESADTRAWIEAQNR